MAQQEIPPRTLEAWGKILEDHASDVGLTCFCGKKLLAENVDFIEYGDDQGLPIENRGKRGKRGWVYIHCPKCGHDWSYVHILRSSSGRRG